MRDPAAFWERTRRSLDRAWSAFRRGAPEGVEALSDALERTGAAARALGDRRLERRARKVARRLSKLAALEGSRELLRRVRQLGFLPLEAAASLDARWEELSQALGRRALRRVRGRPMRKLRRALARRAGAGQEDLARRLERHRRAGRLSPPAAQADDRELARYRSAVRRKRAIAAALEEASGARGGAPLERDAGIGDALERWSRLRRFGKRLERERREAERRGTVMLALELDGLICLLEGTLERSRREALEAIAAASNVVSFRRRGAENNTRIHS
ncbi:MAG: hypothetical protein ACRD3M_15210 [Thermoanaerobaculia bacterium]